MPSTTDRFGGSEMSGLSDRCRTKHLHTPCPTGYTAWHEWAEKKGRRHYQVQCPGCGLLTIWKRKPAGMADDEFPPSPGSAPHEYLFDTTDHGGRE